VDARGGAELFRVVVLVLLAGAGLVLLRVLARARRLEPARIAWILGVAGLYVLGIVTLCQRPEEAVHFVQYGALGVLAFRALGHRVRDGGIYLAAAAVGSTFGILDEFLQWLTPRRVWDLRDIGLNVLGAGLVQPALAFGLRPTWVRLRPAPPGVRATALAVGAAWLVLGGSLLLTPPRIASLTGLPLVGATAERGDVMLEYGRRIEHPEIGLFRSRLAPEVLRETDRRRAQEAASVLEGAGDEKDAYRAFLRRYNPITDPFLHELRVHLFRRDVYRRTAEQHPDNEDWYRYDLTVSWRENRILEEYFGESLAASGRAWSPEERAYVREHNRPEDDYESRVSEGLVTAVGPGGVAVGWLAGLVLLGGVYAAAGRRRPGEGAEARPADGLSRRAPS